MEDQSDVPVSSAIDLTAEIVSAYVSNNVVRVSEMSALIAATHAALAGLNEQGVVTSEPAPETPTPSQIRKSVTPDALISFIDGKAYKTLKRHLTRNGLTIETYRERYGLPRDYPSTAASYSARRSELARSLGLGQQRRTASKAEAGSDPVAEPPKKRGRPKKAA